MTTFPTPPFDLGPYVESYAKRKSRQLTAMGATCEVVTVNGKFFVRVTALPS